MPTKLDEGTRKVMELIRLHNALESSRGVSWPSEAVKARDEMRGRYLKLWHEIVNALNATNSEVAR